MSNDTELKKKLEERETSPGKNLGISDSVSRAETMLKNQLSAKPGAYQSAWQTQLDDTINKIMNRQKFTYDLNGDALYQQYKDKYIQQGQMAMLDTMGQAQAMTGGYGNSYAQSVGQQAYQGHLQNLNDIVPELYKLALDNYNTEGQNLLNQYAMLGAQDEQDYGRYRDRVGDYNADLGFAYQNWRDLVGDQQWQTQFDEAKRQYDQEWAKKNSGSVYKGGEPLDPEGPDEGTDQYVADNGKLTPAQIINMQYSLGVSPTGEYDEATWRAAGGLSADDAYAAWNKGKIGKSVNQDIAAASKAVAFDDTKVKSFLSKLPYVPAGGNTNGWKNLVESRLEASDLSEEEKIAVLKQLQIF